MSRTDKDRPYWVRVNDNLENRVPFHYCGGRHRFGQNYGVECTINDHTTRNWRECGPCGYSLRYHRYCPVNVPDWFVHYAWTGPERVRERDALKELAREYNSYGEVEDEFANVQHRHNARWLWD